MSQTSMPYFLPRGGSLRGETSFSARRVKLSVLIGGHDATSEVEPALLDFSFADNAGGKADEVQITLHDREGRWNGPWKPARGMAVAASITALDWFGPGRDAFLPCGSYTIDELEFSGPPDRVRIKAVSASLTTGLRDEARTRAWENHSLQGVATDIAAEHGLELMYQGDELPFARQDQRKESDLAFLNRLASERAMRCKVHDGRLILFDAATVEEREPDIVIPRTGGALSPVSYSFRQSSSGTAYEQAEAAYVDPALGETHTAKVWAADSDSPSGVPSLTNSAGSSNRGTDAAKTLQLDARVESAAEAVSMGRAALHNANADENPATLELMGHPGIVAGITLSLTGFGDFSGAYFVDRAEHKISGSGGYVTSVELRKRQPMGRTRAVAASMPVTKGTEKTETPPVPPFEDKENPAAMWEKRFDDFADGLVEKPDLDKREKLMLCLPDIALAEANGASAKRDKQGWLALRSMFHLWFSSPVNFDAEASPTALWVDLDWIRSYERGQGAYDDLIRPEYLFKPLALSALTDLLREDRCFSSKPVPFDYTNPRPLPASGKAPWQALKHGYFQRITVSLRDDALADGLLASMGNFDFRALAAGIVEPLPQGGHKITVERVSVFVWDSFNFEQKQDGLGYWSCPDKDFSLLDMGEDYRGVSNQDFRDFRAKYNHGGDFMVLSRPEEVEPFQGFSYNVRL